MRTSPIRRVAVIVGLLAVLTSGAPSVSAAVPTGNCVNQADLDQKANAVYSNPLNYSSVRGVQAMLWSIARVSYCPNPLLPYNDRGIAYWVALAPAPDNQFYGQVYQLRIGVAKCDDGTDDTNPVCDGVPHFFYSVQPGCQGGDNNLSSWHLMSGNVASGGITFTINRESNASYTLSYSIPGGASSSISISGTNADISCWLTGTGDNARIQIGCSYIDTGDSCGYGDANSPGDGTEVGVRSVLFRKSVNGSWLVPGNGYGTALTCFATQPGEGCSTGPALQDADTWNTH